MSDAHTTHWHRANAKAKYHYYDNLTGYMFRVCGGHIRRRPLFTRFMSKPPLVERCKRCLAALKTLQNDIRKD